MKPHLNETASVYVVWHVRHAAFLDGRPTEHRLCDGELVMDDEDDAKVLGVFRNRTRAESRIQRARDEPGFSSEPDCFYVDEYELDVDQWVGGFASIQDSDDS